MIHLVVREPVEYQKTLCQALHDFYDGGFVAWFADNSRRHFREPTETFAQRFLPEVGYLTFFRELKADSQAVVILGGWSSAFAYLTLLITTVLRVPVLIWADHPHPRRRNWAISRLRNGYVRFVGRRCAGFLACGGLTALYLQSLGIPKTEITNFPYWVTLPQEWSLPARCQPGRDEQPLGLIAVGRQVPVKAFAIVIEAVAMANQRAGRKVATLELVGDGPERGTLEALVRSCDANDAIAFSGWLDNHEAQRRIRAADALVIPSTFEPYGVVVLEALANGRPVLASDGVVAARDRNDGSGAILFHPAHDREQLAEQIRMLSENSQALESMCQAARAIAETWPPERAAVILDDLIKSRIQSARSFPETSNNTLAQTFRSAK